MGTTESGFLARLAQREAELWLARASSSDAGPTAAELQSSVSWRVTAPLRWAQPRQRLVSLRQGRFGRLDRPSASDGWSAAREALRSRLLAVYPHVTGARTSPTSIGALLAGMVPVVRSESDRDRLWLLMTAVSGCFPDDPQLTALARDLESATEREAITRLLGHCGVWTERYSSGLRRLRIVVGGVVAVVDFTAKHGYNSGVQRVTRETVSRWERDNRNIALAAFTADSTALRGLADDERRRVTEWDHSLRVERSASDDDGDVELIVPWRSAVFVPEVPGGHAAYTLAALARYSGNRTVAVGYDTIPVSSAPMVARVETQKFTTYLVAVKYFDLVIGISRTAAAEFAGFAHALGTQGLPGPEVIEISLPIEQVPSDGRVVPSTPFPTVLTVGNNERRKNQIAVVAAAELLWREGLEFELVIMGGHGDPEYREVNDAAAALAIKERPVRVVRDASEDELAALYRASAFSVFVSTHEGYGLPVAESLAVGTPVVATAYGSTSEIAEGGGCLLVDPRDEEAIADAMRELLGPGGETRLAALRAEIGQRRDGNWDDYADLVAGATFGRIPG